MAPSSIALSSSRDDITSTAQHGRGQHYPDPHTSRGAGSGDCDRDRSETKSIARAIRRAELTKSADPVRDYLRTISTVPLLAADQEVELAKRIEVGVYAAEKLRRAFDERTNPNRDVQRDLRWLARNGEQAKSHLIQANLRLVVSIAKRYTGHGLPFLDLIPERI